MTNKYIDLISQTFNFPQEDFKVKNGDLYFNGYRLMDVVEEHKTPTRLTFLPKISMQIQKAKQLFNQAINANNYKGKYHFSYCTKASHFSFVLEEALKNDIHIETSSAFDIDLVERLFSKGQITKTNFIIANGYKTEDYQNKLVKLINNGFDNIIPVMDSMAELNYFEQHVKNNCKIGIRIASDEEPNFEFYTSRLGIRYNNIIKFYKDRIKINPNFKLKMLHFFINTGIKDTGYYWNELNKAIKIYIELKQICPELEYFNIGGGLPIKHSLGFDYDYEHMINEIVSQLKLVCGEAGVAEPSIFTEFGSFTVGESGIALFKILQEKQQNDKESWYMIDGSIMSTIPDIWGINQRFIMLPLNQWNNEYQRVNIGGLSCDIHDYYNAEAHLNQVFLPKLKQDKPLYIGFFHIGAYQESLSGYGGIKHCLLPAPKHVLVNKNKDTYTTKLFAEEQKVDGMLDILGYK